MKIENQDNKSNKKPNKKKEDNRIAILIYIVLFLSILAILNSIFMPDNKVKELTFSDFITEVNASNIEKVKIFPRQSMLTGTLKNEENFKTNILDYPGLIAILTEQDVNIEVAPITQNWFLDLLSSLLFPVLLLLGLWFFIFRQAQGMNKQAFSFGNSKAKKFNKDDEGRITFADIAGIDEAVEELQEIVDFLKYPKKYQDLGAKIPKGLLLVGTPGTGKTLLAKAIAGEADVSFFNISGSEFVEMFVGVGASRVRDLFLQAKKNMPSIIFVDEIDAVGRHRGAGVGGGHDEREQTLNQLLVEMDGFSPSVTVIIIAATNRPDILDPALLRPGRFDRQIIIDKPDVKGREAILKIHARGKKLAKNIDLSIIARRTPGFAGADLANLVNEATLLAARRNKKTVSMLELEEAIDRIIAGPERKSRIISNKEKEIIAYHEVGHAIVAKMLPGTDPVHKISILPRGMALGYTLQLPLEDKYLIAKQDILNETIVLLGGRAAEEIFFKEITTGASNDIERATRLVHQYVCKYGMSKLGPRAFGRNNEQVFLGREMTQHDRDYGDKTADLIDTEIDSIINTAYEKAKELVKEKQKTIKNIVDILMQKEHIEGDELEELFKNEGVVEKKNLKNKN